MTGAKSLVKFDLVILDELGYPPMAYLADWKRQFPTQSEFNCRIRHNEKERNKTWLHPDMK